MSTDTDTYAQRLLLVLRLYDIPSPQIAEILAEVDSHVAETGEQPRQAFGTPSQYAAQIAAAHGRRAGLPATLRWGDGALAVVGLLGGWLLAGGVFALGAGAPGALGLPAAVMLVAGLGLWAAVGAWLVAGLRRHPARVLDPRSGEDMSRPAPRWASPAILAAPGVSLMLIYLLGLWQR